MTHIKIKRGLNIPLKGCASGSLNKMTVSSQIGLNLSEFTDLKLRLFVNIDDKVKIGQPLLEDKLRPRRYFVTPAAGVIKEIRRGAKEMIETIVIYVDTNETFMELALYHPKTTYKEQLIEKMLENACFTRIH